MRFTKLFPESDPELVQEVQQQYFEQASALRSMGFVPVATVAERVFPFSLLVATPLYWLMKSGGEVLRTGGWLQFSSYYPVWAHPEHGALAEVNKLSIKFYARYADGAVLLTSNKLSSLISDESLKLYGKALEGAPQAAWSLHLERMNEQRAQGGQQVPLRSFDDFPPISNLLEKAGGSGVLGIIGMWLAGLAVPLVGVAAILNALGVLSLERGGDWRFTPDRFSLQSAGRYLGLFVFGLLMVGSGLWLGKFIESRRKPEGSPPSQIDRRAAQVGMFLMLLLVIGTLFLLVIFSIYLRTAR